MRGSGGGMNSNAARIARQDASERAKTGETMDNTKLMRRIHVGKVNVDQSHLGAPKLSRNTKGYPSIDLAMGFANVRAGTRAGTRYPPEHQRIP